MVDQEPCRVVVVAEHPEDAFDGQVDLVLFGGRDEQGESFQKHLPRRSLAQTGAQSGSSIIPGRRPRE